MTDKESNEKGPDGRTTIALIRRFWEFARPHRRWIFTGLSMIPIVAAMTTLRPLLLKHAVDVNIAESDAFGLRLTGIAFLVAVIAEFLCQATQVYTLQRAGHGTISDVRGRVFSHVLRLPNRYFDKVALGNLLTRTTSDVEALSETMSFGVFMILTDIVMIGSILAAMFVLNAGLTLITLTVAPVLFIMIRFFGGALRTLQLEVRKSQAAKNGFLAEMLTGVTVVQLFGRERFTHREYNRLGQRYLKATQRANIFDALLYAVMDGVSAFAIALMLYFAAPTVLVENGAISLGLLFAFIDYLQRIFVPIKEFSGKLATIQRASASLDRIYGLLDEPCEPSSTEADDDPLSTWDGGLEVRDLTFAYSDDGPQVLKGLSFDVQPGEVVAVVGRTGSGKSSLGRVLTRFYDGYGGSVTLPTRHGAPQLRDVAPDQLRKHLLMVQQDVFVFNDDVAYNISLGDPELEGDPDRLREALRIVEAEDLVDARGGLQLEVGERGGNLSAGEAQLIAFARVAARRPKLLILDEATASVDSLTEQKVQRAIEHLFEDRSVIVIAHRLSTIRRADKILVLQAGKIVEQGPHQDLMDKGGVYADLYLQGFEDE